MWKLCVSNSGYEILIDSNDLVPAGYRVLAETNDPDYLKNRELELLKMAMKIDHIDESLPLITVATRHIDAIADDVYNLAVSSPAKLQEYNEAEIQALAWKADPTSNPPFVTAWAQAKNWTNEQAANDILATAATFKQFMLFIRMSRLSAKEQIRNSNSDKKMIANVMKEFHAKMDALKAQL